MTVIIMQHSFFYFIRSRLDVYVCPMCMSFDAVSNISLTFDFCPLCFRKRTKTGLNRSSEVKDVTVQIVSVVEIQIVSA